MERTDQVSNRFYRVASLIPLAELPPADKFPDTTRRPSTDPLPSPEPSPSGLATDRPRRLKTMRPTH